MLGEWYLPPGVCQVISTITEGTISISHPPTLSRSDKDLSNPIPAAEWSPTVPQAALFPDQEV